MSATVSENTGTSTTPNTLTITYRALADLILPVLPHVDGSRTMPILESVKLETVGGFLTATATDRYTIAVCRMAVDESVQFSAIVDARELRALLAMFKPRRGLLDELTLTVDPATHRMRVEGPGALFSNAIIEYAVMDAEYPKVNQIFDRIGAEATVTGKVSLNPALLAKFQHAARQHEPIVVRVGQPNRPVFITAGEHFIGAIMTTRWGEKSEPTADWTTIFPDTVKGELVAPEQVPA